MGVNPATALATVLVDELARCGVRHAVLAPGSRSAPLAMALHADERLRLHVDIDERSAGFRALGIARGGGGPAIVVTTSGTAVANLLPAVVEADAAALPLLVLSADRPPELRDTGANQTIDQAGIFGRFVRAATDLAIADDHPGAVPHWRAAAARAFARSAGAGEGAAGPVQLNVGFREPLVPGPGTFAQPLDGRPDGAPWTAARRPSRAAHPDDVDLLRRGAARRGVVVLGDGAPADPWMAFAAAAGWPVLAEPLSGRPPGAIGAYDQLLRQPAFAAGHRPELAVIVGRVALSAALRSWLADDVEQVLVEPQGRWFDPARRAQRVVAADAETLVTALLAPDLPAAPGDWLEGWRAADDAARAAIDAVLDADDRPSEPRAARDLSAVLPDGAALVVASSMPVRDLDLAMRPRGPLAVVGNRGASGIDGFVATALGVAAAHEGPVAALAGDLSLLHDQNALLGSPRPDLCLVVLNNDGGAIFSFLPQVRYPEAFDRLFTTPHGRDLSTLARLYGCAHTRIDRAADLPPAVTAAVGGGGVHLVEVPSDRAANVALHRRITDAVGAALA